MNTVQHLRKSLSLLYCPYSKLLGCLLTQLALKKAEIQNQVYSRVFHISHVYSYIYNFFMNLPTHFLNLLFQLFNLNVHTFFVKHNGSVCIYMTLCIFLHREKKMTFENKIFYLPSRSSPAATFMICGETEYSNLFFRCHNKPIICVREPRKCHAIAEMKAKNGFPVCICISFLE